MKDQIIKGTADHKVSPMGMEGRNLVFGWQIVSERQNVVQISYQVLVGKCLEQLEKRENLSWDSGKREGCTGWNVPYEGKTLEEQTIYYWQVLCWNEQKECLKSPVFTFETGILQSSWNGQWIGAKRQRDGVMPVFRRGFQVKKKVQSARLYACSLGQYELWVNGKKASDQVLEPAWSLPEKVLYYEVYDLTKQLHMGENGLGVYLGNGMNHIEGKRYAKFTIEGTDPGFILQMRIIYVDGTMEEICSDGQFQTMPGPVTYSCIFGGEDYDGTKVQEDFSKGDFAATGWQEVIQIEPPKGKLVHRINPPIKVKEVCRPQSVKKVKDGVYVYDFGVNFSGWTRLCVQGEKGLCIRVVPGELLGDNGEVSQEFTGAPHYYQYTIGNEEQQSFCPKFTFYGFRYVQIEGAVPAGMEHETKLPKILSIQGEMLYTDMDMAGKFQCSIPLWNQIHEIILQAMKSNAKSVLTDCPHREKLGWLEETHLMGPSLMYNFHMHDLYKKILQDISLSQRQDGLVPSIAPEFVEFADGFRDSPEWGSASVILPWYLYEEYGDIQVLKSCYDSMSRYVGYLTKRSRYHIVHHGLGDWCDFGVNPPFSQNTPIPVTATAVYYYDLRIMEQVSHLLGMEKEEQEYKKLGQEVKAAFNREFFDEQGKRYVNGSQAANALALVLDIPREEDRKAVLYHLVKDIRIRGNHTTGGDVGHPFILRALRKYGMDEVISDMTIRTDNPSYGFQVVHGATSLCEEWDGNMPGKWKNSQNHFMLGSIDAWFYEGLAGIGKVNWRKLVSEIWAQPYFDPRAEWAEASHELLNGTFWIRWERVNDNECIIELKIPVSMVCLLRLKADEWSGAEPISGELELGEAFKEVFKEEGNNRIIRIGSGSYKFLLKK